VRWHTIPVDRTGAAQLPARHCSDCLPETLGVTEAARRLGITRQALSAVLNGRAGVGAGMALRLQAALGTSAEMWMEMQAGYDFRQARQQRQPKVARIAA
jgi:addiction module HigA family antidote